MDDYSPMSDNSLTCENIPTTNYTPRENTAIYMKQKFECACGKIICNGFKRHHFKTVFHVNFLKTGIKESEMKEETNKLDPEEIILCGCGVQHKRKFENNHCNTKTHMKFIESGKTKEQQMNDNVDNYMEKRQEKEPCSICLKMHSKRHMKEHMKTHNKQNKIS